MTTPLLSKQKSEKVNLDLRRLIKAGHFPSGGRIPTWDALEKSYKVSRATLQRSISLLKQDGFLKGAGKRGTFVNEALPFKRRFALVYATPPDRDAQLTESLYSIFFAAESMALKETVKLISYKLHSAPGQGDDLACLLEDARQYRIGGAFFLWQVPKPAVDRFADTGLPFFTVRSANTNIEGYGKRGREAPSFMLNYQSFQKKALSWLKKEVCQRPAAVSNTPRQLVFFQKQAHHLHLKSPAYFFLSTGEAFQEAEKIIRLLMALPESDRPDSLIITDDKLLAPIFQGLKKSGIDPAKSLKIVAFSPFPHGGRAWWPVKRIGYPLDKMLEDAINQLRRAAKTGEAPAQGARPINALFDDEYY